MTTKRHPFDLMKAFTVDHANALERFRQARQGIDDVAVKEYTPCTVVRVADDEESFDVQAVGVVLRCVLSVMPDKRKGAVTFYRLDRVGTDHPSMLGTVEFNVRNGYTDLRHFSEFDGLGDLLALTNPYGMKEVLAQYFLKALGDLPPSAVPFITRKSGVARLIDLDLIGR